MIKNIFFVVGAGALLLLMWWVYQFIGEFTFLIGFVALFVLFIKDIKKPKFGNKKKANKPIKSDSQR